MDNQTRQQKTQQHLIHCQQVNQSSGDKSQVEIGQHSPDAPQEVTSKQKQKMQKYNMSIDFSRNKKRIRTQKKSINTKKDEKKPKKGKHGSSCKGNLFNLLQKYTDNQLEREKDQCIGENQNNYKSNNTTNHPTNRKMKNKVECSVENKRSRSKTMSKIMSKKKSKCKNGEEPMFYLQQSEAANFAKRNLLTEDNFINQNIVMTQRANMNEKEEQLKNDNLETEKIKNKMNLGRIQTKGSNTEKQKDRQKYKYKDKQKEGKVEGWSLSYNQNNKMNVKNSQNYRYEECKTVKKQQYGSVNIINEKQKQKQKSINLNKRSCKSVINKNNNSMSQISKDININSYIQSMCNNTNKTVKNKIYNILKYEQTLKQLKQRVDHKYRNISINDNFNILLNTQINHPKPGTQANNNNQIQQMPIRLRKKAKSSYGYYNNCDSNANSNINLSIITLSMNDKQNQHIQKQLIGRLNQNQSHQSTKYDHPLSNNFYDSKMQKNMNGKGKWIYVSSNVSSPASHCNISRIYNIQVDRRNMEKQVKKDEQQKKEKRLQQLRKNRKYKYHKSIQKQIKNPTKNIKKNSYLNLINIKNNQQNQTQDVFRDT